MSETLSPTLDTRRAQMFPQLDPLEVERIGRFGEARSYGAGEMLFTAGDVPDGMFVVLSGQVRVTARDEGGEERLIVEQGPGNFLAEIGQLAGRPSLVTGVASGQVEALVIPSHALRALMVAEAEMGERIMRALILRRVSLVETGGGGPVIVGAAGHAGVVRLSGFLTRNAHPHHLLDPDEDEEAQVIIDRFRPDETDFPVVLCPGGEILRNPSEAALARYLGLLTQLDETKLYDVAVVGAGPAGLATAVYATSEGLSVLVIDQRAPGGQAGASARIENYLGFPTGISGYALTNRAYHQAQKFGADMAIPAVVEAVDPEEDRFRLQLADGQSALARSVVIASGVNYRRPDIPGLEAFEGSAVHFWASPVEARLCASREVVLVGGGNSAGQAAVYLASHSANVSMLVRGKGLSETMSQYLIERIDALPNVTLLTETEITALEGEDGRLEAVRWTNRGTGEETRHEARHLFLFIGAEPNTDWLSRCDVALDGKGFVLTGAAVSKETLGLETSLNGVFAIGDVRSGSTKRVASAVGEGAQVVATLHRFLADPTIGPAGMGG